MRTESWVSWREHFTKNEARPPIAVSADPSATPVLLRTLAILQRAETGEGRIAKAIDGVDLPNIDGDYRAALKMFVREEARHAGLLGELLAAHGARPFTQTWRDGVFSGVRRLAGVRFKIFVFLAAEVAAVVVFGLLVGALPDGAIRRSLMRMRGDEAHHLAFHAQFFRTLLTSTAGRWLFRAAFLLTATAATLAIVVDHRRALGSLGVRWKTVAALYGSTLAEALELAVGDFEPDRAKVGRARAA